LQAISEEDDVGFTKAFLMGAGTAYLLDPTQGKRRRRMLLDRTARMVRQSARLGTKKVRFVGGHARGLVAIARRLVSQRDVRADDATVTQRIRSDALRDVGVSAREVDVDVVGGVATLRGSVANSSLADDLVGRVRKVPGVRDVQPMLRVSEEQ
jgi:osmotically-inducible protein OsmY